MKHSSNACINEHNRIINILFVNFEKFFATAGQVGEVPNSPLLFAKQHVLNKSQCFSKVFWDLN